MSGCSRWNFADGLPETSNCYCHPGIAGGSPAYARAGFHLPLLGRIFVDSTQKKLSFVSMYRFCIVKILVVT